MRNNYLDFAVNLAYKAGAIMRLNFRLGMKRERKSDHTPVTVSDKEINQLVIDNVRKYYPSHSVIAEEGSDLKSTEYAWVCDPIDGTIPFTHGYPTSVFALALVRKGESILGVIYDPFMDRLVTAVKGEGAHLNKKPIHVSASADLKSAVIDVGTSIDMRFSIGALNELLRKKGCFPSTLWCVSYAGMLVASGEFAAIICGVRSPWDGAANKIIIEEAGGKVTDLFGEDQRYDKRLKGIIATNGKLHDTLVSLVKPLLIEQKSKGVRN